MKVNTPTQIWRRITPGTSMAPQSWEAIMEVAQFSNSAIHLTDGRTLSFTVSLAERMEASRIKVSQLIDAATCTARQSRVVQVAVKAAAEWCTSSPSPTEPGTRQLFMRSPAATMAPARAREL